MTVRQNWAREARLNEARLEALLKLDEMGKAPARNVAGFALEQAGLLTNSRIGYLAVVDDPQGRLTTSVWTRDRISEGGIAAAPVVYPLDANGLWQEALRQRRAVSAEDGLNAFPYQGVLPECGDSLRRHLDVPIYCREKIVAVAGVGGKVSEYDHGDIRQVTLLMDSMWAIIDRHAVPGGQPKIERKRLQDALALQEREQRMIAYDIHDGLAQQLTSAAMHFQTLCRHVAAQSEEVPRILAIVQGLLDECLKETRSLVRGLRPPTLDKAGAEAAIREFLLQARTDDGMTLEFASNLGRDRMDSVLENSLFRIVQEAVNNARRHSRSNRVNVVLSRDTDSVRVAIEDWGTGFDPGAVPEGRFGLEGIRERAKLLSGEALIDSTPGAGTRVVVTLPLSTAPPR